MTRLSVSSAALAVALLTMLAEAPVSAGGFTTRWVDDDGLAGPAGCNQLTLADTSIQDAIDSSGSGDLILVCPGDYVGPLTIDSVNNLTVRATKPWVARLVSGPDYVSGQDLIHISGVSGTTIQWLELKDSAAGGPCNQVSRMIMAMNAPHTQIRANHLGVQGTETIGGCGGYGQGIFVDSSNGSIVSFNRVVDFQQGGIVMELSNNATVRGNAVLYNHVTSPTLFSSVTSFGILLDGQNSGNRLVDNLVKSPPTAGVSTPLLADGILIGSRQVSARIITNRVQYAGIGMDVFFQTGAVIRGNRIRNSATVGMSLLSLGGDSVVQNNFVRGSGGQGVHVSGTLNLGASFTNNDFRFNGGLDCDDDTIGTGTGGTANIWTNDFGIDDDPTEICLNPASP